MLPDEIELSAAGMERRVVMAFQQRNVTCIHKTGYGKVVSAGHVLDYETANDCHDTHKHFAIASALGPYPKQSPSEFPASKSAEHLSSRLERPPQN